MGYFPKPRCVSMTASVALLKWERYYRFSPCKLGSYAYNTPALCLQARAMFFKNKDQVIEVGACRVGCCGSS